MTIFTTPILSDVLRVLSKAYLSLFRWEILGKKLILPEKSVIVAYPHTTAWDLPYTVMIALVLGINVQMAAKRELFTWWLGPVLRFLGCVPVARNKGEGATDALAYMLRTCPSSCHLVMAPTGTRKTDVPWKTGFFYVALLAEVPVLLATIDSKNRRGGIFDIYQLKQFSATSEIQYIKKRYCDFEKIQ